jgi:hypothetical protein
MTSRTRAASGPGASLLAAALLLSACGGRAGGQGNPVTIDWDLSGSHTVDDVDWPRPDLSAVQLTPVESVRIRFPGSKIFQAGEEVHDVTVGRELVSEDGMSDQVANIQVDFHPLATDEAYLLATRLAREWRLPRDPLDDWHQARVDGRESGQEDLTSTTHTVDPKQFLEPQGPQPFLQIRYSFNDQRPSIVSLQFSWPAAAKP